MPNLPRQEEAGNTDSPTTSRAANVNPPSPLKPSGIPLPIRSKQTPSPSTGGKTKASPATVGCGDAEREEKYVSKQELETSFPDGQPVGDGGQLEWTRAKGHDPLALSASNFPEEYERRSTPPLSEPERRPKEEAAWIPITKVTSHPISQHDLRPSVEDFLKQDGDKLDVEPETLFKHTQLRVTEKVIFQQVDNYMKAELTIENTSTSYYGYLVKCNRNSWKYVGVANALDFGLIEPLMKCTVPLVITDSDYTWDMMEKDRVIIVGIKLPKKLDLKELNIYLKAMYRKEPQLFEWHSARPSVSEKHHKEQFAEMKRDMAKLKVNSSINVLINRKMQTKKEAEGGRGMLQVALLFVVCFGLSCLVTTFLGVSSVSAKKMQLP